MTAYYVLENIKRIRFQGAIWTANFQSINVAESNNIEGACQIDKT
jgi:hypothetical protein